MLDVGELRLCTLRKVVYLLRMEHNRRHLAACGIFFALSAGLLPGGAQSIIMPSVAAQLNGWAYYGMVFTVSTLATAVFTPLAGRLGDWIPRRRLVLAGTGIVVLSNLAAPFCPRMELLVALRFCSGLGSALVTTPGLTLIGLMYPAEGRVRWMGYYGMLSSACNGLGPILGGLCTDLLGWQWVYFFTLPLGAAGIILLSLPLEERASSAEGRFDGGGLTLFALFMTAITLLCQGSSQEGFWHTPYAWLLCILLSGAGVGFAWVEHRLEGSALLPLSLFRIPLFSAAMAATFLTTFSAISTFTYFSLYLQNVAELSPSLAGIPVTAEFLTAAAVSPLLGRLMARTGDYRAASTAAALVIAAISLYYSMMSPQTPLSILLTVQIVYGLAASVITSVYLMAIQAGVPERFLGQATAGLQLGQTLGGTVGAAVMGAVASSGPHHQTLPCVFQLAAVLAALAILPSLCLGPGGGRRQG